MMTDRSSRAAAAPFRASVELRDEADTAAFGAALADIAETGDVMLLDGDLGAGKTVLARGFIRRAMRSEQEVPSPTFTLVQNYDAPDYTISHFDLYRIESVEELPELGLDDAFANDVSLIEWPDRLGPLRPRDALTIRLHITGDARRADVEATRRDWRRRAASVTLWDTLSTAP